MIRLLLLLALTSSFVLSDTRPNHGTASAAPPKLVPLADWK